MTGRLYTLLLALFSMLLSALSLGGQVFYLFALVLFAMLLYGLFSVLLAKNLLEFSQHTDVTEVERGESATLSLKATLRSPLPIAPLQLNLALPDGDTQAAMDVGILRTTSASYPLRMAHVGVFPLGAQTISLSDVFGLFRMKKKLKQPLPQVVSLPRPFGVERLKFPPQDDGNMMTNRSGEDITSPEDTRSYRQGDPLKRIHWKLSQRMGELIVRKYEVPSPPDTLILMDCSDPVGGENQEDGLMRLRDTLCETALSVAKMQMEDNNPVRVPLYGARTGEFQADHTGNLQLLREELAYQLFRGGEPFDKTLNVELRRMRRTGATVVITTRLDAKVVEAVKNIRLSGPNVRYYYVTFTPDAPENTPFISRLQHHLVEVCYVTPA